MKELGRGAWLGQETFAIAIARKPASSSHKMPYYEVIMYNCNSYQGTRNCIPHLLKSSLPSPQPPLSQLPDIPFPNYSIPMPQHSSTPAYFLIPLILLTLLACQLTEVTIPTVVASPRPSLTPLPSHTPLPTPNPSSTPLPTPTSSPLPPTPSITPSPQPSLQPSPFPSQTPITFDPEKLGTTAYNLTYCRADGQSLLMDMHYPEKGDGPLPVAVYIHGGTWTSGYKSSGTGHLFFDTLLSRGYLVVAVDYRLSPAYKFPAHIEDVKCAIRHLRAEAGSYGLDPEHIGVFGGSAGGHLAALLGTSGGEASLEGGGEYLEYSSRVQAVVDIFGPVNAEFFCNPSVIQRVFGTTDCHAEIITIASPLTYISPDDPPFLIMHGREDDIVPLTQSIRLYAALASAGLPSKLVIIENTEHSLAPEGNNYDPDLETLREMVGDFFDHYLKNLP